MKGTATYPLPETVDAGPPEEGARTIQGDKQRLACTAAMLAAAIEWSPPMVSENAPLCAARLTAEKAAARAAARKSRLSGVCGVM